jgi:hypothetical protein
MRSNPNFFTCNEFYSYVCVGLWHACGASDPLSGDGPLGVHGKAALWAARCYTNNGKNGECAVALPSFAKEGFADDRIVVDGHEAIDQVFDTTGLAVLKIVVPVSYKDRLGDGCGVWLLEIHKCCLMIEC